MTLFYSLFAKKARRLNLFSPLPLSPQGCLSIDTSGYMGYYFYMPRRKVVLANDQIYHIFNRSIAREDIFSSKTNLYKVFEIVDFYRFPQRLRLSKFKSLPKKLRQKYYAGFQKTYPLVEIYCFAFMPNHYHFLLKQIQENGIKRFISNFQNSFAKIFNLKNNRDGALFQNSFKAKWVETDEQFIHLSRYIHLNPVTSYIIAFKELEMYPWTSFPKYMNKKNYSFVNVDLLLSMFKSREDYSQFVSDQVDYQKKLTLIKDLILE